jgi:hypothetical protein
MAILIDDFSTGTHSVNLTTGLDDQTQAGNKITLLLDSGVLGSNVVREG